jgi:hypothetical protein
LIWTEKSKEINGKVKMFSGCLDMQTSADCQFTRNGGEICNHGAFTWMLLSILNFTKSTNQKMSNKEFLVHMYDHLKANKMEQIPQISTNSLNILEDPFDI